MKPITIDMLSVGDKVYYYGNVYTVFAIKENYCIIKSSDGFTFIQLNNGAVKKYFSRIPCTAENTVIGDLCYCESCDDICKYNGVSGKYVALQKELAEHLARQKGTKQWAFQTLKNGYTVRHKFDKYPFQYNHWDMIDGDIAMHAHTGVKYNRTGWMNAMPDDGWILDDYDRMKHNPLFSDAEVGDLVRFSNGQVEEVTSDCGYTFVVENGINKPLNKIIKKDGTLWQVKDTDIHATDLIKKGSAEWAWEMMVKGEFVDVNWDKGRNSPYYIKDNIVRCGFSSGNLSEHQTKESWLGYWGNAYPSGWQLYDPKPSIRLDESENKNPRTKTMTKQQRTDLFNKGKEVGFKAGYEKGVADQDFTVIDDRKENKSPTYDEVQASYENGRKQGYQEGVVEHCKMCRDDELMRSEIDTARKEGFAEGQATLKFCPMCSKKLK